MSRDDFQLRFVSLNSSACLRKTGHDLPGGEKTAANQSGSCQSLKH